MTQPNIKRLNWGCGGHVQTGWIHCDIRHGPHIQLSCDITNGLPLETDSIDYAVSTHALQEIPFDRLVPALAELRRVLVPGGTLRLVLPDLLKGVDAYKRGDRGYFLVPDNDAQSIGAKLVTQILWYGYSRVVFTPDFAEELLIKAGFARVAHCTYHLTASTHAAIVNLDNREAESMFIEATK